MKSIRARQNLTFQGRRSLALPLLVILFTILTKLSAFAQDAAPALPASSPAAPSDTAVVVPTVDSTVKPKPARKSQNVTINLINRLVERGVLSNEDAAELIKQAEEDTVEARA